MGKAIVAIVGRPNVGKSTLFNRIIKKRRAVIEDFPGVTRDRLYGEATWEGKSFLVVDTGGFQHEADGEFAGEVKKQLLIAVEEAYIVLLLLDGESGLLPLDTELIAELRKYGKRVFYAVNKIDGPNKEKKLLNDFYSLGVDIFPVSALSGHGFEELMEAMSPLLTTGEEEKSEYPRIATVGRPNVGKSTLVNSLLGKERMIVSSTPGTTRDAVDSVCSYYKKKYIIIDTAGIRRKGKMAQTVERYSFMRTLRNVEDCDIALIVLDASEGVVELDQKIAGAVIAAKKGAVIIYNKWDLVNKDSLSIDDVKEQIYEKLWFMRHVPILTISALSKQRMTKVFSLIDKIIAESSKRITTHNLNTFMRKVLSMQEPPMYRSRRVKIYYITQVKTAPPGFTIFTNQKDGITEQYKRFLEKQLREHFKFEGAPIEIYVRQRKQRDIDKKRN
ncbi:MAG: ribosome biogenesis GTPase Der [Nitrospirae bacterium]|nr:ribosome biogenesis GTPase Der [Nitrospirota bacterium]